MSNRSSSIKTLLRFLIIFTLISVPVDQWSKALSRSQFLIHEDDSDTTIYQGKRFEVLSFGGDQAWFSLNLTYVRNHGASWGLMRELPAESRLVVLITVGLIFSLLLCLAALKFLENGDRGLAIGLVLMVAGSFGNFIDRARLGYVVDFITLRSGIVGKTWALPTFNVADMIIVISLFCVLTMALSKKKTI